jgi:signal transduction histidine kinase
VVDTMDAMLKRLGTLNSNRTEMLTLWTVPRVTALGRLALAFSLLFLAMTESGDLGFEAEPDDLAAATYLLLAIALVPVGWRSWWLDHKLQPWALGADLLTFVIQPSLLHPHHDGYRIAALTLATYILLSVALRWNWRLSALMALVLNLMNLAMLDWHPLKFSEHFHADHAQMRSAYFLLVISLLIVWVGSRINGPRAPSFRAGDADLEPQEMLGDALDFALVTTRTRAGSICWRNAGQEGCLGSLVSIPAKPAASELPNCTDYRFDIDVQACLFDLDSRRCLVLEANGGLRSLSGASWQPADAIVRSGFRQGAIAPMRGGGGRGLLIVSDCQVPGVDLLRLLAALSEELAAEFDRFRSARMAREEELDRLRNAIARDLHDSVAQTIAGTRYWLSALGHAKPTGADLEAELARLDEVLGIEAEHLRTTIQTLRLGAPGSSAQDFAIRLTQLLEALADQWRVTVALDPASDAGVFPQTLDFEIQQMVREGVSNAVRHGGASRIDIRLSRENGVLTLAIADNGCGFADHDQSVKPRMLAQRATDLGGSLKVGSSSEGSVVTIQIPLGAAL